MKKIFAIMLSVLTVLLSIASCRQNADVSDESTSLSTSELVESTETEAPIVYNTYDISSFSISFKDVNDMDCATFFKEQIKKKVGVDISIARSTTEKKYEFLIGNSGREISKAYFDAPYAENAAKYGVVIDGTKVFLAGRSKLVIMESIKYFIEKYVGDTTKIKLEDKVTDLIEIDPASVSIPVKSDVNGIRFVTNNILKQSVVARESAQRGEDLKRAYLILKPDVVAMQEVDSLWIEKYSLESLMGEIGYKMTPVGNKKHSNPIIYNEKTVKLIDSGYKTYGATDALGQYKSYQWALFEQLATGKRFIAVSTHFISGNYNSQRTQCANQLAKEIKKIASDNGNVPVIIGGDFNTEPSTSACTVLKSSFNFARETCKSKVNMEYCTANNFGEPPVKGDSIDHVFYSKSGVTAKHFETVISTFTYCYADHVPVCFDCTLD